MLTFLNSAILVGLAAVAIPLLIHLFTRQKTRIITFSSLRFLKELQQRQIRKLKLRQILLLILRMLLILALVLTFARPALKQTASASLESGAQLTAVIILDNTLSMGLRSEGQRLLEQAKKRALKLVDHLRPGDEIYLLYPQDPPVFAHEGPRYSLETIRELIEATELSYSKTDFTGALSLANQVMEASANINKEVYLICDLQKNGLRVPGNDGSPEWFADRVKFFVLPVTAERAQNLAISDVRLGNQILEKGKVVEVQAEIRNDSDVEAKDKLVHLFVEGKRVAQDAVTLAPHSAERVVFRMVPDRTGPLAGYVLLEDDDLLEDNRRYFTFTIPDAISTLLVGGQEADTYFLETALRPEKKTDARVKVKTIPHNRLRQEDLSRYDVLVLSNVPQLDHVLTMKIKNFVEAGGGLLVFLGADVDLRNYNENLHARLKLPPLTASMTAGSREQFLSLGKIDFSHPLFQGVFEDEKNVISPHFRLAINVSQTQKVDKIIEFSNGAPFLFESRFGRGRILYVPTAVASDWSDLALRGIFVPLVNRSVAYLGGYANEGRKQLSVGGEIRYAPEKRSAGADLEMALPDGERVKIKPEVAQGKFFIKFNQTLIPGVYDLYNGEEMVARWAVNYDADEVRTERFETADLEDLVAAESIVEITDDAEIERALRESRFGRELWKYFALLALLLMLTEMALYREKASKAAT